MAALPGQVPSRTGYFSVIGKSAGLYLIGKDDFAEPVAVGDELNLPSEKLYNPTPHRHQGLLDKASAYVSQNQEVWKCIEVRPLKLSFRFYNFPERGPVRVDHLPQHKGESLEYFFIRKITEDEDQLLLTVKSDPLFQQSAIQVSEDPIKLYTFYPEGIFNSPE